MACLKCKYETDVVKIREDYLTKEDVEMEDVTPYKPSIFKRVVNNYTFKLIMRILILILIMYLAGVALNILNLVK